MRPVHAAVAALTMITAVMPMRVHAQASRLERDTAFASMVAAERAFAQHSMRISTQGAFRTYMASNGMLFRPRAVKAHDWLRARPMPQTLVLGWEPVFADIAASGDLGYTTGPWIASHRQHPDAQPTFGEYVTLWRRQADGSWKAEVDAGIAHEADPIGPGGLAAPPAPQYRASATQHGNARASLLAADSAFEREARAGSVVRAYRNRATPHARLLRNGRFPLLGDSAAAFMQATPGYTWRPTGGDVSRSGDLGYTYGAYAIMTDATMNAAIEAGNYLRIWRREANGEWRIAVDLISPSN